MLDPTSFLFVTLDSCRYDAFLEADLPRLKSIGSVHRAIAPAYFTFPSHQAMFVGYTPGDISSQEPYVNPRRGQFFRMIGPAPTRPHDFMLLRGRNVIDALKRLGFLTLGTGAVGWFNPHTPTSRPLTRDFHRYFYPGNNHSVHKQVAWAERQLRGHRRVFLFINIGETHMPYYHQGAPWPRQPNPAGPNLEQNDAAECRRRQTACLEFLDIQLAPLLDRFRHANILICSDHGDAWGEDGHWGHSFYHPKVVEVPLVFHLAQSPSPEPPPPTLREKLQWHFQRLTGRLPDPGERART